MFYNYNLVFEVNVLHLVNATNKYTPNNGSVVHSIYYSFTFIVDLKSVHMVYLVRMIFTISLFVYMVPILQPVCF